MKAYDRYKISDSTLIKLFPDGDNRPDGFVGYNGFVADLLDEIDRLNNVITQKDEQISTLISNFDQTIRSLDAKYQALFSQKMAEFEDTFVKIEEDNQ